MKLELLFSSAGSMAIKLGQAGLGLLVALLLARWFGADEFGVYVYAVAMSTLAAVFSRFGFHVYIVYAVNRAISEGRRGDVGTIFITSLLVALGLSLIAGFILWLVALTFPLWEMSEGLIYGSFLVSAVALLQVLSGAIQAFGRVQLGLALEGIGKPILFLGMVSASLFLHEASEIGFEGLLTYYILSEFILILSAIGLVFRWIEVEMGGVNWQPVLVSSHIREARSYLMANALIQLYQQAGLVSVGIFFSPAQTALFRIASQVASLIPFGLQALQSVMRPKIARMYSDGPEARDQLQDMMTLSTRILFIVQSPLIVLTIFFPSLIVSFFGSEFLGASMMLSALAVGQSYSIICGMNGDALNMTGRAGITAWWSMVALVVVLSLLVPCMELLGALGAAVAISVSRVVWNTGLCFSSAKHTGLHTSILGKL